jgi:Carboxymuconolactone decarboxylase family
VAGGNTEQLRNHLLRAKENGLTETELKEAIIHLAFYAGSPAPCRPSRSPRPPSPTNYAHICHTFRPRHI